MIEYTASPYCKSLKPLIDEMIKWGEIIEKIAEE
ncbi:MAG: hypothetical protein H7Y10_10460 [Flavobacterium sp.]|nr:hypothetical protein [Flavobacterium sp.]